MPKQKGGRPPTGAVKVRGKDDGCCGIFFLKYLIYIFNFILWVSGLAVLGVGLWTLLVKTSFVSLLTSNVFNITTLLLLATGGIIIIITFIGCCGAWRENVPCLLTFACFLLLIFLLEVAVGILAYMYLDTVENELTWNLNQTMLHNYKMDDVKTQAIDEMQRTFRCCGAGTFEDWQYSRWRIGNLGLNNTVPDSCCKTESPFCAISKSPSNIYYDGCKDSLVLFLKQHLIIIGSVGLGLCCLQLFGIIFSCLLGKKIKQWKRQQHHTNYW